jgi:HAD superfamily hydrolase (TIGR01509 family)
MTGERLSQQAWLFDVDGTLVDSNYLHVAAWLIAFHTIKRPVEAWRIHRSIGMDSELLLARLLGDDAERLGSEAQEAHDRAYQGTAHLLAPLPGSRELLRYLAGQGATVVLATSAPPRELELLRSVLQVDDTIAAFTDADDVDTAKPDPSIVHRALAKSGHPAVHAVFIGDSIWDMQAAQKAAVRTIGVRTGGISDAELRSAGANVVYDGPADLLLHIGDRSRVD